MMYGINIFFWTLLCTLASFCTGSFLCGLRDGERLICTGSFLVLGFSMLTADSTLRIIFILFPLLAFTWRFSAWQIIKNASSPSSALRNFFNAVCHVGKSTSHFFKAKPMLYTSRTDLLVSGDRLFACLCSLQICSHFWRVPCCDK